MNKTKSKEEFLSNLKTPEETLKAWRTLCDDLPDLEEKEVKILMAYEKKHKARPAYMSRLFGRYSVLLLERERKAYLGQ